MQGKKLPAELDLTHKSLNIQNSSQVQSPDFSKGRLGPSCINPSNWNKHSVMGSGREGQVFGRIFLPTVIAQELLRCKDLGGGPGGKPRTSVTCLTLQSMNHYSEVGFF